MVRLALFLWLLLLSLHHYASHGVCLLFGMMVMIMTIVVVVDLEIDRRAEHWRSLYTVHRPDEHNTHQVW